MASLVFTLIGPDRPGLVERVATCIAEGGGSWQESEFLCLDGQFAGLLRVRVPAERLPALRAALERLEGVTLTIAESAVAAEPPRRCLRLDLVGADRTGIVRDISHTLAKLGINLVSLESWTERAAMSGEPMFRANARLDVPAKLTETDVRAALEHLANDLMVEMCWLAESS